MCEGNSLKDNQWKGNGLDIENPYEILGISEDSSQLEIEEAFHRMMKALDPSTPGIWALWTPEELNELREKVQKAFLNLMQKKTSFKESCLFLKKGTLPKETWELIKAKKGLGGEVLREIRELLGLSLEEASSFLKITKKTLIALENEDFDNLPPWVYLKGFLRAYAKLLGIQEDEEELIKSFEERYQKFRSRM